MQRITSAAELRAEIERVEGLLGIESDIRISLRERLTHVLNVADTVPRDQPITHSEIAGYIGDVYYLRDLEIAGDVLLNTDTYKQRRTSDGKFASGTITIQGEPVY